MQTHDDRSHTEFLDELRKRARERAKAKDTQITSGYDNEEPIDQWVSKNGMTVTSRPSDKQGIIRISVGGGTGLPVNVDYCTIRGESLAEITSLLHMAIEAIQEKMVQPGS